MSKAAKRLAILISGRGSNMLAIARACQQGTINAGVVLVLSNRPGAAGIESARELGLETAVIDHTRFASRQDFDLALHDRLLQASPDLIVLAGFMRILTESFVNQWQGRIVNIHPSLLPRYPGLDTHARAIEAGDTTAGATVHFVTPGLDEGGIIDQTVVPILPGDTPELLADRVIQQEHGLYVRALQALCN